MDSTQETHRSAPGTGAALLAFAVFALISAGSVALVQHRGGFPAPDGVRGEIRESTDGSRLEMATILRRLMYKARTSAFRKAEMVTVAGDGLLDLTGARMAEERGQLEVVVIGGHAQVKVPPDWEVISTGSLAVGAIRNDARHAEAQPVRTLRLKAVILGGALEVTH
jgi:hypothetical protein